METIDKSAQGQSPNFTSFCFGTWKGDMGNAESSEGFEAMQLQHSQRQKWFINNLLTKERRFCIRRSKKSLVAAFRRYDIAQGFIG
jgi:hypothetical protein